MMMMMMMMGKGRVKGLVVGGCGPPGVGTFSPVRLRSMALASYQGSSNTLARHLLTTATAMPALCRRVRLMLILSFLVVALSAATHARYLSEERNNPEEAPGILLGDSESARSVLYPAEIRKSISVRMSRKTWCSLCANQRNSKSHACSMCRIG
ncbi:hypothetical protein ACOMHN_059837 [Nucella lapillus]